MRCLFVSIYKMCSLQIISGKNYSDKLVTIQDSVTFVVAFVVNCSSLVQKRLFVGFVGLMQISKLAFVTYNN